MGHDQEQIPVMSPQLPKWEAVSGYIRRIDANRWYSNFGPLVCELESRLCQHFDGADGSCLTMANATLGIALALQDVAIAGAKYCLMPSWTFVATPHAALVAGLSPLFADCDPINGMLTPEIAEKALAKFENVGAVIVVGPFGMSVPVAEWRAFRDRTGVPVIIDAAACFDSATLSDIPTIVSLHATKPLGCGEGGFVMSKDVALIERLRGRSNFGFVAVRQAVLAGTNAKMSEYHAAVALAALDEWGETRGRLFDAAALYRSALTACAWATLPTGWGVDWISTTLNVRLERRVDMDRFQRRMKDEGADTRRWWSGGCHLEPAFAQFDQSPLPVTTTLAQQVIGVPFSRDIEAKSVQRVTRALEATLAAEQRIP